MTDKRIDAVIAFVEETMAYTWSAPTVALLLKATDDATWVDVNDVPLRELHDFDRVLFVVEKPSGARFMECGYFDFGTRMWTAEQLGSEYPLSEVTHWRPMPELPPKRVK